MLGFYELKKNAAEQGFAPTVEKVFFRRGGGNAVIPLHVGFIVYRSVVLMTC